MTDDERAQGAGESPPDAEPDHGTRPDPEADRNEAITTDAAPDDAVPEDAAPDDAVPEDATPDEPDDMTDPPSPTDEGSSSGTDVGGSADPKPGAAVAGSAVEASTVDTADPPAETTGGTTVQASDATDDDDGAGQSGETGATGATGETDETEVTEETGANEHAGETMQSPPRHPGDLARIRLRSALWPRATRRQLLAAVVCAVLGFAAVVQAQQSQVHSLASLRQSDLITLLDNVTQESARLDAQEQTLQRDLDNLRAAGDKSPAARQAARARLDVLGVLAGTVKATGPGIELTIVDPQHQVSADILLETVQELRDAGAEAMQIGPVRVVASTAFVDGPPGVLIDRTVVNSPYQLLVIGDPPTLSAALEIPGGVLETLRGKGATGTVIAHQSLTITALRSPRTPQYARPASSPGR